MKSRLDALIAILSTLDALTPEELRQVQLRCLIRLSAIQTGIPPAAAEASPFHSAENGGQGGAAG